MKGTSMDVIRTSRHIRLVMLLLLGCGVSLTTWVRFCQALDGNSQPFVVPVVDKAGYDKVIAAHKGKVVVVDCWATWCVPCRKAFPKTIALRNKYKMKDLAVISLSFDELVKGKAPQKVEKFLLDSSATGLENLICSLDLATEGAEKFEIPDGALPHFKIYGKDGKLFQSLATEDGAEIKHEDVEAAVKKAMANTK